MRPLSYFCPEMIKRNIPNFLTLCNLFCGCMAIVFAFGHNLIWSAYLVGIACVFDFLDGMVARLLNVKSEIGKQLDSLADMVSFGVVPGVIMYNLILYAQMHFYSERMLDERNIALDQSFGLMAEPLTASIAFLIPIFSAIRLAKFNLDSRQVDSFIGLPTPANTILIASLVLITLKITDDKSVIVFNENYSFIINLYFLVPLIFISSFLLIAPLPLFALKFKNFSWQDNKIRYIFLALALALLIVFKFVGIPLIIILYIVLSIIYNLFIKPKNASPANYK